MLALSFGQDTKTSDITERIRALEQKDHDQAILLEQYKADLHALTAVVSLQSSRVKHQETLIQGFTKKVRKLEKQVTSLQTLRLQNQETLVRGFIKKVSKPEMQITSLQKVVIQQPDDDEHDKKDGKRDAIMNENETKLRSTRNGRIQTSNGDNGPVLFHAVFSGDAYEISRTVRFPTVVSNLGSGYNSTSSVFTAAQSGIYLFSLTVTTGYGDLVRVGIVKNGITLAGVVADGNPRSFDQGSVTVTTKLVIGDVVCASAPQEGIVIGRNETSFLGLLVMSL